MEGVEREILMAPFAGEALGFWKIAAMGLATEIGLPPCMWVRVRNVMRTNTMVDSTTSQKWQCPLKEIETRNGHRDNHAQCSMWPECSVRGRAC